MAIRFPKVPKVRVHADVSLQDGTQFRGQVFIEATTRIQEIGTLKGSAFIKRSGS